MLESTREQVVSLFDEWDNLFGDAAGVTYDIDEADGEAILEIRVEYGGIVDVVREALEDEGLFSNVTEEDEDGDVYFTCKVVEQKRALDEEELEDYAEDYEEDEEEEDGLDDKKKVEMRFPESLSSVYILFVMNPDIEEGKLIADPYVGRDFQLASGESYDAVYEKYREDIHLMEENGYRWAIQPRIFPM